VRPFPGHDAVVLATVRAKLSLADPHMKLLQTANIQSIIQVVIQLNKVCEEQEHFNSRPSYITVSDWRL
jgi:hypothetical protein